MLSAITFGINRQLISQVQDFCAESGDICIYKTLYSYPEPYQLVQLLDVFTPEVVFLELTVEETALKVAQEIRSCHPKTAILGFAKPPDSGPPLEAARFEVEEVIMAPFVTDDFQKAVTRAIQAKAAKVPDNVIVFLPAKGGSGSSTATVQTARALATDFKQKVLVIETDVESGVLAVTLNVEPEQSILDALEKSQWLSESLWCCLPSAAQGFDVLPMPSMRLAPVISRWEYQRLLSFVRRRYDMVIADLPELVNDATEAIVKQAKGVYILCTPDKASLFLARRRLDEAASRDIPAGRLHVVLNRARAPEFKVAEVEKFLDRSVSLIVPDVDWTAWQETRMSLEMKGKTPPKQAPADVFNRDAELRKAFSTLARMLAGVEAPARTPPPPPEPKGGLRSLFSRSRALQTS